MADPKRVDSGGGLGAVADLLKLFGGTQQTTKSTGDTSALQGVLGQLQAVDPGALLQTVFQQALGQAPALQARFTNAVGGRSANAGASQAALSQLLQDTAIKGQAQVMQQQQQNLATQAQVANSIAQATGGQKSTSGTNLGKAATGLGALQAIGTATNSDLFKKGKDALGSFFSSGSDSTPSLTSTLGSLDSGGGGDWLSSFNGGLNASTGASDVGITSALGGISDFFGSSGSSAGDAASAASDSGGLADSLGGAWDSVTDFFGFADGGLVGRDGSRIRSGLPKVEEALKRAESGDSEEDSDLAAMKRANAKQKEQKKSGMSRYDEESKMVDKRTGIRFADGGPVNVRSGGGRRSSAPSYSPDAVIANIANQNANPGLQQLVQLLSQPQKTQGDAQGSDESGFQSLGVGTLGNAMNSQNMGIASNFGQTMMGLMGVPGMKGPAALLSSMLGAGLSQQQAMTDINAAEDPIAALMTANAQVAPSAAMGLGSNTLGAAANAVSAMLGVDPMEALMSVTDAFGTGAPGASGAAPGELGSNADPASGFFGTDMGGSASQGDDGGLGDTAGSGNSGGDDGAGDGSAAGDAGDGSGSGSSGEGYRHGGDVQGKGSGTSDSIDAKLSDGEYVISADVVDKLGVEFFDQLQKEFHQYSQMGA